MLLRLRWKIAAGSTRPIAFALMVTAFAFACPASAQKATSEVTELPPVVVEGPTDEVKAARKKGSGTDTRLTVVDGTPTTGAKGAGTTTTPGGVSTA